MLLKKYVALVLVIILVSCKKNTSKVDNPFKFKDYISSTTSGLISIAQPIQISLVNPTKDLNINDKTFNKILTITPHVNGKLTLDNSNTLIFTPEDYLKPKTEYTVSLKLSHIYKNIADSFKVYTFQFKTITPNFNIETYNLQSYSKQWQYLEGVIKLADIIKIKNAKTLVEATQNGKKLPLVFKEVNKRSKYIEFKIDSIYRPIDDSKIVIKWQGKSIKANNRGENHVTIPGQQNFTILKVEVSQGTEQFLSINFSDPLKKQQNFDGLIAIQKEKSLKYIVDGNVLRVYPNTKLVGNIKVDVFKGIKNVDGYKLKQPLSKTIAFKAIKPQVRLINNGTILPNSKNLKFNFEAVNLSAIDVRVIKIFENNILQLLQDNNLNSNTASSIKKVGRRVAKQTIQLQSAAENLGTWKAYSIDLSKFFNADAGAIYRVELSFKKHYSLYTCNDNASVLLSKKNDYNNHLYDNIIAKNEDEKEEMYWDNLMYSYKNYTYNWREEQNPCHHAYYNQNKVVSQNLLASNLGVIIKKGTNNSYYVAVTNILNTKPLANAKVTLYNFQQQELASKTTNIDGLTTINIDKHAAFAIVSKGINKTYVKLQDGHSLSLSKFDISGHKLQRGLKGYLYAERGIWRPGDSLHLTFMLNDNANPLPKKHPIKLEITDPNGKLVYKNITKDNLDNFYKFTVPTSTKDKTGNYNAKVSVGSAAFYKTLKIETVKPNRLKIKVDFDREILTKNIPFNANLDIKWLHGTPGKNLKVDVKAKFSATNSIFKNYKNYTFNDPTRKFKTEEINIFEGTLSDAGLATINKKLHIGKNAPGMLNAQFLVRAFENGGNFSIDAFTKTYAPYNSFIGLRSPKSNAYGSFFTDTEHKFNIVAVDKNGKPLKRNNLDVKIYKIEWRWWWNASYDDLASYVSSKYHRPYTSLKVNTSAKGAANFKINIPDEDRGRYLIRVVDSVSGHATGNVVYFYKNWWQKAPSNDKEAAKMLVFSADKENYNVGETAKVTFTSGSKGRALISIENGSDVLDYKWIKTTKGETVVDIPITKRMAPNIFVNISLLQPHANTSNNLPIRLYGVIPLMVEHPSTKLHPQLQMPDVLKPEHTFNVIVSEKRNKPMTYTIAVVEEGLLDLTRFKTPNAWNAFYKREALGVKTWDIFDNVIGAYSGSINQVYAIGGDGSALAGKHKKANRFKPVAKYLGPFTLAAGKTKTHQIKMPNYIGSVRTMVVAGHNTKGAYGSTDKTVSVKKPLMVLATLPRKLSLGEKVILPVTVFAMESKVKNVTISLNLSNGISIIGDTKKTLRFKNPDEKMVYFKLDVSKAKGTNMVEVIATGNGEKSTYKVELDVVNTNPITSKAQSKTLAGNAVETLNFSTFGVNGTNLAMVEFSTLPPMDFTKRLEYVIEYPHGCVEQITSSVFPQLYLEDIFDLTLDKKNKIITNIKKGIEKLGYHQRHHGGLSYWLGESSANDWGTSYAGHFMIEAEKKGYVLPLSFKSSWLNYQKQAAKNWRPSYKNYNSDLAQAYRLYTLALAHSPDLASMNRLREFSEISNEAKWKLAAAYALAGQTEASNSLVQSATINFKSKPFNYTYGSASRNRAIALETMVLTKHSKTRELANTIAQDLSSNRWMSTQTTAYSLLAMAKLLKANGGKALHINYTINGKTESINTKNAIAQRKLNINSGINTVILKNKNNNVVYVRVLNSGKLPLGQELTEQRGLNILVNYKDLEGKPLDISKLSQGEDFVATVKVSNLKNYAIDNVALTQILPSGWEIVNTRYTAFGNSTNGDVAKHTDIRDDRVYFYFDLPKQGAHSTKTFNIMLNASYLGTYYLPGIQAEAMYNNDFLVRTKGNWITIKK